MRTSSSWRVWRKLTSIIGRSKKILGTKSRPPYDPGTWLCSCMTCADNLEWAGESLPALKGWFYTEKSCYQFPSFFLSIQVQLCAFYRDFLCLGYQVSVHECILVITCAAWDFCLHMNGLCGDEWEMELLLHFSVLQLNDGCGRWRSEVLMCNWMLLRSCCSQTLSQ